MSLPTGVSRSILVGRCRYWSTICLACSAPEPPAAAVVSPPAAVVAAPAAVVAAPPLVVAAAASVVDELLLLLPHPAAISAPVTTTAGRRYLRRRARGASWVSMLSVLLPLSDQAGGLSSCPGTAGVPGSAPLGDVR